MTAAKPAAPGAVASSAEIGRRAGVSTETVQNHGPKVELLRAAIAAVSFGAGPGAAVADTELGQQLLAPRSATEAARSGAEVLATVNERSHGVWMAFSEASRNDEALSAELRRLTEEIGEQTRIALEQWRTQGWLREDLPSPSSPGEPRRSARSSCGTESSGSRATPPRRTGS